MGLYHTPCHKATTVIVWISSLQGRESEAVLHRGMEKLTKITKSDGK